MKYTFTITMETETDNTIGIKEQIACALEDIGKVKFVEVESED